MQSNSYDPRRVFRFNLPQFFHLGSKGREIGTYVAGGLVSNDDDKGKGEKGMRELGGVFLQGARMLYKGSRGQESLDSAGSRTTKMA